MDKTAPRKYRAPALDKGLDILELLASATAPLSINAIAEGIGRSRGEIFRMLQVLEERDYIARGEHEGGYTVTPRLFRLGMQRPPVRNMLETALPAMRRLAAQIDHACHVFAPCHEQAVVIARVDPPGDMGLVLRVGYGRLMSQSAAGHALLAWQDDDLRERWLDAIVLHEPGLDRKKLLKSLHQVRARGYASLPSPRAHGVIHLAVPLMQDEQATHALMVPFMAGHASTLDRDAVCAHLRKTAGDISEALQHRAKSSQNVVGH